MKYCLCLFLSLLPLHAQEIIITPVDGKGEAVKVDVSGPVKIVLGEKEYHIEPAKKAATQLKAESIILPSIDFEEVTLDEAVFFIDFRAKELDKQGAENRGVNLMIVGDSGLVIDELRLKQVSIHTALSAIALKTGASVEYGPEVITVRVKE